MPQAISLSLSENLSSRIKRFHNLKIVDDDQNLVLQLVLKHTNLFKLYYQKNFMVLWGLLLNKSAQDSIKRKAIVTRVGTSTTKKTQKKSYSKKNKKLRINIYSLN